MTHDDDRPAGLLRDLHQRAEAAEAKVARVEALIDLYNREGDPFVTIGDLAYALEGPFLDGPKP